MLHDLLKSTSKAAMVLGLVMLGSAMFADSTTMALSGAITLILGLGLYLYLDYISVHLNGENNDNAL